MDSPLPGARTLAERAKLGSLVTPEERHALLDGLYEEDHSVDMLEYHAKVLKLMDSAVFGPLPPKGDPAPSPAEAALERLRGDVRRLCHVLYAGSYLLANKAERFWAELPPDDGADLADFLLSEVKLYAGQYPKVGTVEKRAEVTEALREVMEDTQ